MRRHSEFVVPDGTAGTPFDYLGTGNPSTIGAFIDAQILGDFNVVQGPAGALQRQAHWTGGRAVFMALVTETALLSTAPAAVVSLAASLVGTTPESYVLWSDLSGDAWIIAQRAEGLRHGGFDLLRRMGVRYFGAHTAWRRRSQTGIVRLSVSGVFSPAVENFTYGANGGLNTHGVLFAGALRDSQAIAETAWRDLFAQQRHPRGSATAVGGDGGSNILYYKHPELSADRTMLAWVPTANKRGPINLSNSSFYSTCQTENAVAGCLSKLCYEHHGLTGSGAGYPTRPTGSTPWVGYAVSGPACVVPNAITVGAESATAPQPSDYTSFDGLTKLLAEHSRDVIAQAITSSGDPLAPTNYYVGVSPTDGRGSCLCTKSVNLLRNGQYSAYLTSVQRTQDATFSDNVANGANKVADFLAYWFANSPIKPGVSWLAYQDHSEAPSIPIAVNSSIFLLPQTVPNTTNRTAAEVIAAWSSKRSTNPFGSFALGMAPTWLTAQGWDRPVLSPIDALTQFKRWIALGYTKGLAPLTSYSSMTMGAITYGVAELCWDPTRDPATLVTEWLSAFGAAATQVTVTFTRWWQWFELTPHELGRSFRDMQAAQTALSADPNATSEQQAVLDHLRAYVQWLAVYYEYEQAITNYTNTPNGTTLSAFLTATDTAINWCWNVAPFNCIQADLQASNMYNAIPASGTGTAALIAKWDRTNSAAAGWALVSTPTTASLTTQMATSAAAYVPVSGVTRRDFGYTMWPFIFSTLCTWSGSLSVLTPNSDATLIDTPRNYYYQTYRFRKGVAAVTFHFRQGYIAGTTAKPCRIRVLDDHGAELQVFEFTATNVAGYDDKPFTITVAAGDYTLEVNDDATCAQTCYLQIPRSTPFVQLNPGIAHIGNEPPYQTSPIPLYFYVPVGETAIVLAYPAFDAPNVQLTDNAGTPRTMTRTGLNQFSCAVPAGQDGKVWSWTYLQGRDSNRPPHFENCPNLFSPDKSQVMVPAGLDGH